MNINELYYVHITANKWAMGWWHLQQTVSPAAWCEYVANINELYEY